MAEEKIPSHEKEIRIGWIGTGIMGLPMARHMLELGASAAFFVHTRTRSRADALLAAGAQWADTPGDLRRHNLHVIFSMVGLPEDVENVVFGGLLSDENKDFPLPYFVDMSTSSPELAKRIAREFNARGSDSLDAPVSGGDVGARERRLAVMVGGSSHLFEQVRPLLARLSTGSIRLMGGPGAGQHTKLANQIVIASGMIGVCEGLFYAAKAGLDPKAVVELISTGAAGSFSLRVLGPRMLERDFAPGFLVEHFIKDLRIALEEAERMRIQLPGLQLAKKLYDSLVSQGHSKSGTQVLITALEHMNKDAEKNR